MAHVGNHLIIDLNTNDAAERLTLADLTYIQNTLTNSANAAGATILKVDSHQFGTNQGVTAFAMLAESHISVHTWPENGYAAFDIFMCGDAANKIANSVNVIKQAFSQATVTEQLIKRNHAGA